MGTSSATDEKRETLREWVRGQMRAGEMANEPERLERKRRPAQQGPAEPWQSATSKKTKNVRTKGKAKQEVLDDFFEGDDSDANECTEPEDEAEERDNVLSEPTEMPTKRRQDKSTAQLHKGSETVEKRSRKTKHKKHRGLPTLPTPIVQDRFSGDDQSD